MSFFTNLRADRLVTEIRAATDPASPATQKSIAKLRDLGSGAIEPVFAALPEADKNATVAFVEVLTGLVTQKTFPQFVEGLVQGSPRVIAGIAWALAWAAQGAKVGILDADIYGPSQPLMLGLEGERPTSADGKHLQPLESHGITAMSIGFLVDAEQPMVWRGPMVTQALTQLLSETHWGQLDYLVVDMPPGTGDIQLTLAQRVPVAGAVIVTTPQDIALADARKGLKMFEKVSVPVLGIVENMSIHVCSNCGHAEHIFGAGGGGRMAEQYGVRLLGELPLDAHIREEADSGRPTVVAAPDTPRAKAYLEMARRTAAALAVRSRDRSSVFPKIVIEES
jgi:ATP-binding protein involved in chromosome partitioning